MTAQQIHTPGTFDEYRRRAAFVWRNGLDWAPEKPAHPYEPHWNAFRAAPFDGAFIDRLYSEGKL